MGHPIFKSHSFLHFTLITVAFIYLAKASNAGTVHHFVGVECSHTNSNANSTYVDSLYTLLHSLTSNTTELSNGYGYRLLNTDDAEKETLYGMFVCRGDINAMGSDSCQGCVIRATYEILQTCPTDKKVTIWYDQCVVRYSNVSFLGRLDENEFNSSENKGNNSLPINKVDEFNNLVIETLTNISVEVVLGKSQSQDEVGARKYYGTKKAIFDSYTTLYTMVQCTPDLTPVLCNRCLNLAIISKIIEFCKGRLSCRILNPSCFTRYETNDLFYNDSVSPLPVNPPTLPPPPPPPPTGNKKNILTKVIIIIVALILVSATILAIGIYLVRKKAKDAMFLENGEDFATVEFLHYDLSTLQYATNNFSEENKLGEGGFGGVFKGTLLDGQEIAVKRLSRSSNQGIQEFKNEVILVAKLQHKNLVRLLGFCLTRNEKLLVYEYVPNKSLDYFLFGHGKQETLDWGRRHTIIRDIARGMLYLHQDSRLRIIHRDLKASNVLLDADMTPKISDFGMARIFDKEQIQGNTNRVVGTFGYMSPEYAMHGQFSIKSDVYSFGVLVLEIVSSKRNNTFFYESDYAEHLISYAWKQWKNDTPMELVDPTIRESCSSDEVMRCIHIGLLCIQDNIDDRPTMEKVVLTLDSHLVVLPLPKKPVFFIKNKAKLNFTNEVGSSNLMRNSSPWSVNGISITEFEPR